MSECKQCPHAVGDAYQRDCAYPDCRGGYDAIIEDLREQRAKYMDICKKLSASNEQLQKQVAELEATMVPNSDFLQFLDKYRELQGYCFHLESSLAALKIVEDPKEVIQVPSTIRNAKEFIEWIKTPEGDDGE